MVSRNNIPIDWAAEIGWCTHIDKRPVVKPNEAHLACPLSKLTPQNPDAPFGFITSTLNNIAIIDIDHVEATPNGIAELPLDVQSLIAKTYTEISLSGKGLHIIFRLNEKELYEKRRAYIKAKDFSGQLSLRRNFMVATGNKIEQSPDTIATVSYNEVPLSFVYDDISEGAGQDEPSRYTHFDDIASATADGDNPEDLIQDIPPEFDKLRLALQVCKIDQSPGVLRAYKEITGQEYEHYQYWLSFGMALHAYGRVTNNMAMTYALFLSWSQQDKVSFVSEEDVKNKWQSFNLNDSSPITWKTILAIAARVEFNYPKREIQNGKRLSFPLINEWSNFKYLLDKYNIELFESDGYGYYIKGDEDICQKYFNTGKSSKLLGHYGPFSLQALCASTLVLCQDSHWRKLSSTNQLCNTWIQQPREELDMFQLWMDTPEGKLDEVLQYTPTLHGPRHISKFTNNSTFDYVEGCIKWASKNQTEELSRKMLYKTFMQLIKFRSHLELPFDDNGGMLAFLGPENTRKTTFFKMLLPQQLAFMRKEINMQVGTSDKGLRDFMRYLGKRVIVQIDEFEGFLDQKKAGSILKAVISGNNMSITDIYQTEETNLPRRAIIVGTSNETRHVLSQNGSRRMWLCEVEGVDTNRLLNVNWHAFYNNMRKEFNDAMKNRTNTDPLPWLMSQEDVQATTKRNTGLSAVNDMDILLEELFPYSENFPLDRIGQIITSVQHDKSGYLYSTSEVAAILKFKGFTCPLAALERALERYSLRYIGTDKAEIQCTNPKGVIKYGRLCQGFVASTGRYNYRKWILPPQQAIDANSESSGENEQKEAESGLN